MSLRVGRLFFPARLVFAAVTSRRSDATVIWSGTHTYDHAGNRTQLTENNGDYTNWAYDNIYQLTDDWKRTSGDTTLYRRTFTYDAVGNRLTLTDENSAVTTYTYDDNNKLTQYVDAAGTTTFAYDGNGNTTEMVEPGNLTTTYAYDYENRMTGITYPDSSTASFAYDAAGHRISKTESGTLTRFLYDGERAEAEYDTSWNLQAKYTLEGDSYYSPLVSMKRGTATSWQLYDGLGSTRRLIDSNQAVTDSYSYEAFGDITASSGSTVNPYRYVGALGYYRDATSGLLHVGARYYNPTTGRFVTLDPLGVSAKAYLYGPPNPRGPSVRNGVPDCPYAYAENNPTNRVDPAGLQCTPLTYECLPPAVCPWLMRPFCGVIFGHYQIYCSADDCPAFCHTYATAPGSAWDDCMKACRTLLGGGGSVKSTATCDCKPIRCECSTTGGAWWALIRTCVCENMPPQP
jgi:RHS repeat-associated protein